MTDSKSIRNYLRGCCCSNDSLICTERNFIKKKKIKTKNTAGFTYSLSATFFLYVLTELNKRQDLYNLVPSYCNIQKHRWQILTYCSKVISISEIMTHSIYRTLRSNIVILNKNMLFLGKLNPDFYSSVSEEAKTAKANCEC